MLEYSVSNLFEDITKEQKNIIDQLKNIDKDSDDYKKLDKKLDSIALLTIALIKFKKSCK
jgi:hypothetical protein